MSSNKLTQTARILKLLKTQGQATNVELIRIAWRYSARIADLRAEGHVIKTVHEGGTLWRWIYIGHSDDEVAA